MAATIAAVAMPAAATATVTPATTATTATLAAAVTAPAAAIKYPLPGGFGRPYMAPEKKNLPALRPGGFFAGIKRPAEPKLCGPVFRSRLFLQYVD